MRLKRLSVIRSIQCVVGVVGVMACGALFDQAASGITDQLGAQGAGLHSRGARFRGISPEGRKFLKSEESRRCCDGRPEQNEVKPKFQDLIIAGFRCVLPSLRANFPTRAGELARYH